MRILTSSIILALVAGNPASAADLNQCRARDDLAGPCFRIVGTLHLTDGTPSARIDAKHSDRVLGVAPLYEGDNETFAAPASIRARMSFDTTLRRSFLVCPLDRYTAGRMQTVCIDSARSVVRHLRPRPNR